MVFAGHWLTIQRDELLVLSDDPPAAQVFTLRPDGCFGGDDAGHTPVLLPYPAEYAAQRRQPDGRDILYLSNGAARIGSLSGAAFGEEYRSNGSALRFAEIPGPLPIRSIHALQTPPANHTSRVELMLMAGDETLWWAEKEGQDLHWKPLASQGLTGIQSIEWRPFAKGDEVLVLGRRDDMSSEVDLVTFHLPNPPVQTFRRIMIVQPSALALLPPPGLDVKFWSESDSSIWTLAPGGRAMFLKQVAKLPDIRLWHSPITGRFLSESAHQSVFAPLHSNEWWVDGDTHLTAVTDMPLSPESRTAVFSPGADSLQEIVVTQPGPSFTRLRAERIASPAPTPAPDPRICTGYSFLPGIRGRWSFECPSGQAVMAEDDGRTGFSPVDCCPMPADDALGDNLPGSFYECPDGSVVTGGPLHDPNGGLQCTTIRPRYMLGEPISGVYWGDGESVPRVGTAIERSSIPEWLREGIGRDSQNSWDLDGCISASPGALLTKTHRDDCGESRYRALLYAGLPGDPKRGTPVPLPANAFGAR